MKTAKFVWRENWISQFESPWGVFEKFKYANSVKDNDLFKLFGTPKEKQAKIHSLLSRDLIYLKGFDREILFKSLGHDIIGWNQKNISKLVKHLLVRHSKDNVKNFVRKELWFCPLCIEIGYHSIYHQSTLLRNCPYHLISLKHNCPQCEAQIPYELNDKFTNIPFKCNCGYSFLNLKDPVEFCSKWNLGSKLILKDNILVTWLSLAEQECNPFEKIHFNPNVKVDSLIRHLLSVIQDYVPNNDFFRVGSASYLYNLNSKYEQQGRGYHKEFVQNTTYNDTLFDSSRNIFSSIARKLRNTILKNHKTCINRFIKRSVENEVCPYAYAYIMWRKNIEQLDHYWEFSKRKRVYRRNVNGFELLSFGDMRYWNSLRFFLRQQGEQRFTMSNISKAKWVFNRCLAQQLISFFNNLLQISEDLIKEGKFTGLPPFSYENFPFYILKIPMSDNDGIEFYWWKNTLPELKIECPFNTLRKRRNYRYEEIQYVKDSLKQAIEKLSKA